MADIIFRSNRKEVEGLFKSACDKGMEAVAAQGEGFAKEEVTHMVYDTPPSPNYVRTGRLRNNITHAYDRAEQTAYIGTNVTYAKYVELGTSKMAPRPFLKSAAQNHAEAYKETLKQALKGGA